MIRFITVHSDFYAIPVKSSVFLQLHRDLYKFSSAKGGSYKSTDNVIEEVLPNGTKYIRFKPIDAFSTPSYMDRLCEEYRKEIVKEEVEPLVFLLFMLIRI